MITARGGIITRGRRQRRKVQGLLLRHTLLLRVAGQSTLFSWVGAPKASPSAQTRRRFYAPLSAPRRSAPPEVLDDLSTHNTAPLLGTDAVSPVLPEMLPLSRDDAAETTPPRYVQEFSAKEPSPPAHSIPDLSLMSEASRELLEASVSQDTPEIPETAEEADEASRPIGTSTDTEAVQSLSGGLPVASFPFEIPEPSVPTVPPAGRRRRRVEEITVSPARQDSAVPPAPKSEGDNEVLSDATVTADDLTIPTVTPPPNAFSASSRSSAGPIPSPEASLFTPMPVTEERTPAAWLARLKAGSTTPNAAAQAVPEMAADPTEEPISRERLFPATVPPLSSQPLPQQQAVAVAVADREQARTQPALVAPTLLSLGARRFLRPLIGFDPADVPVYRGSAAQEATALTQADALAIGGEAVLLGSDADAAGDTAPETLGLLAHEMTHIARQRTPRFLPPVIAAAEHTTTATASRAGNAGIATLVPAGSDEAIAQQVESLVRRHATNTTEKAATIAAPPAVLSARDEEIMAPPAAVAATENWNGLPAPWEPLPTFMNAVTSASAGSLSFSSAGEEGPVVQRAPTDRSLPDAGATEAAAPPAPAHPGTPSPDLDLLARQVYDKLKRRLAAEQRQRLR